MMDTVTGEHAAHRKPQTQRGCAHMSLGMAREGQTVRVLSIHAGRGLQARLAALGILPGAELTVLCASHRGPVVVAVKGTRVALGRGMAQRIEVG